MARRLRIPFGAKPYRQLREKLLIEGMSALPAAWGTHKWKAQRIVATPPWQNMTPIRAVYDEARRRTADSGVFWTVGHVIPLNHPLVCGLHVPWNLTLEKASFNFSKGNAWCEYHGDLFADPEQLRLF